jgi:hypothetical protein
VQHYFGIAMRMELVAQGFEFVPEFRVIVDFAVEDQNGIAIITQHGLIAVFQIDDLQADGPQRHQGGLPNVLAIRPAMSQRSRDTPDLFWTATPMIMGKPGNPTHSSNT